jgi:hypothetical protein
MILEEGVDRRPGHVFDGNLLGGEPDTEVLNPLNVLLNGTRGMASIVEIIDVGFDPGTKKIGPQACANPRATKMVVQHDSLLSGQRTVEEDRGLCGPDQITGRSTER